MLRKAICNLNRDASPSRKILRLRIRALSLVKHRIGFPAETSVLVGNVVDAADLEELGSHGSHSIEEIEGIVSLLQLQQARIIIAVVRPLEIGLEAVAFTAVGAGSGG